LTASSGGGKGAAVAVAREAVTFGTAATQFREIPLGSGEGLVKAYVAYNRPARSYERVDPPSVLFECIELDTLTALFSRTGATLNAELRKVWSGELLGYGYAGEGKAGTVAPHSYRACVVLGVQDLKGGPLVTDTDGGLTQRFLFLDATDPEAPDVLPPVPEPLKWILPDWFLRSSGRVEIGVSEGIRTDIVDARRAALRGTDTTDGHRNLLRLKTAATLGIFAGRDTVTDDDWLLAGVVLQHSDGVKARIRGAINAAASERNRARGEAEADREDVRAETLQRNSTQRVTRNVLAKLHAVGDAGITSADLRRKIAARDRKTLRNVLAEMVDAQVVVADDIVTKNGDPGVRYRIP